MKLVGEHRFWLGELKAIIRLLACGLAVSGLTARGFAAGEAGTEQVFKLHEVSVFEQNMDSFLRGQMGVCQDRPYPAVKAYPHFTSQHPVYGSVRFAGKQGTSAAASPFYFAVDESRGTGKGYDWLYLDLNQDLDLRNDPVIKPQRRPPDSARLRYSNTKQEVLFDFLSVEFDFGPAGTRPVQLMPRLTILASGQQEYKQMTFVRTRLYEGNIKLGSKEFRARLGNDYSILGRLDVPGTTLVLTPKESSDRTSYRWSGGNRLTAAHKVEGNFFTFSASPMGDQLVVRPYQGDLGIFGIGPGGRSLGTLTVSGSLRSKDRAVPVGGEIADGLPRPARQCQIPVGDYLPSLVTIRLGRLHIEVSENYHSDGRPGDRGGRPPVYGITVRKDQPFVLDFSNRPDVMFAAPAIAPRVRLGDMLQVKAVLVDPKLDIMIRGLEDTARKQTRTADGRPLGYGRNLPLDPNVIITRATGEKVAVGVMPFG
jgi:hypothetical protein